MPTLWAGIDAGKRAHHCVVIDCDGTVQLSRKVGNDETALLELFAAVIELADDDDVCWATDLTDGGAALLIALLTAHAQRLLYIPGRIVHHARTVHLRLSTLLNRIADMVDVFETLPIPV